MRDRDTSKGSVWGHGTPVTSSTRQAAPDLARCTNRAIERPLSSVAKRTSTCAASDETFNTSAFSLLRHVPSQFFHGSIGSRSHCGVGYHQPVREEQMESGRLTVLAMLAVLWAGPQAGMRQKSPDRAAENNPQAEAER